MWKLWIGAFAASWALALGLSSGAWADGGAGDAWLGNAGQPPAHTSFPVGTITISSVTTTSVGGVKTSIGAITASRHKAHTARQLVRSKRHRKVHKLHVKAVSVHVPTSTG